MADTAIEATVHGRVQGVFFRDSCREQAERHGVTGWVSNEPDGTVRVHLEGPADAVEAVLAWCHEGPPRASVQRVDSAEVAPAGDRDFTVR